MYLIPNTTFQILWSDFVSSTIDLSYSIDGGNNWILIGNVPNNNGPELGQGYYDWLVPQSLPFGEILIRIQDHDITDIFVDTLIYSVSEELYIGNTWRLEWSDLVSDTVRIDYQINGIGDWIEINSAALNHNGDLYNQGYYDWVIDSIECDSLIVRVTDVENNESVYSSPVAILAVVGSITGTVNLLLSPLEISGSGYLYITGDMLEMLDEKIDDILAVVNQLTFTNDLLNVRVADKGTLNDITVNDILSGTVDTKTVNQILEILLAYINGKITVSGNNYIYYKQDGTTSLFTITAADSERTVS